MQRPCEEEETDCTSCKEECVTLDAGTSEEAKQTNEELKREIEDLKAKVAFLSTCSPTGHHPHLIGRPHGPGFTDVVLVAAEDGPNGGPSMPVPAHRAILASRSPVFKAILENAMEESHSGSIKISDMSYDALRAFAIFLYADVCLDEQMACELLVSAEKYQVEHLKAYCEKFLVSKLNWDNSIRYHVFAHQHNANLLFEATLSFFMDKSHRLISHRDFSELLNKHSHLVEGICEVYIKKLQKDAEDTSAK